MDQEFIVAGDKVKVIHGDLQVDLSQATVVTLYLLTTANEKLRPRIVISVAQLTRQGRLWMTRVLALLVAVSLVSLPAQAGKSNKEQDRLRKCGVVLKEILDIPDNIPQDWLDKAECVIVLPSVKKFAIGIGGSYGRGAISCRTGKNFTGRWSAPAMIQLKGVNIGIQLGGQATDFLLLVMNTKGADSILKSKVKLGADAAAAAGPISLCLKWPWEIKTFHMDNVSGLQSGAWLWVHGSTASDRSRCGIGPNWPRRRGTRSTSG